MIICFLNTKVKDVALKVSHPPYGQRRGWVPRRPEVRVYMTLKSLLLILVRNLNIQKYMEAGEICCKYR